MKIIPESWNVLLFIARMNVENMGWGCLAQRQSGGICERILYITIAGEFFIMVFNKPYEV